MSDIIILEAEWYSKCVNIESNIKLKVQVTLLLWQIVREEAEEEFDRISCGDKPQIEDNEWITDEEIYDLEWDIRILDTEEE